MKIKYLGHSSFKMTGKTSTGETVSVITDPFDQKDVGVPYSSQEADIVTVSHQHPDHNKIEKIKGTPLEDYFLIETPGEYEIKGLRIAGVKSFHDDKQGAERGVNAIYTYDFEESRVAHLGDIGHKLDSDIMEILDNIDILMIPVGGFYTVDPKIAIEIIEEVEPQIVIPMHFRTPKHKDTFKELQTLNDFIDQFGAETQSVDTLTVKSHNDLPENLMVIKFSS